MLIAAINDATFNTINLSYFNLLQTDLEEEKAQEIAKLQEALHAMQIQVEEARPEGHQEEQQRNHDANKRRDRAKDRSR